MSAANDSTNREPKSTEIDPKTLVWVRVRDGKPYVAWERVALVLIPHFVVTAVVVFSIDKSPDSPFRTPTLVISSCLIATLLIVVVEWQRQLVISGRPTFRWSLAALLWLTMVAAIFSAAVGYGIAMQRAKRPNVNQAQQTWQLTA